MTCFQLGNPSGLILEVPARQRVRGLVRDALHRRDLRGRRRLGREPPRHADRLHSDDVHRLLAERRRQHARDDGDVDRRGPLLPEPLRRHQGHSLALRRDGLGRAPVTTSASPSTSATSSTGIRPASARASRTSTSARTCASATARSRSTASPGRRPIPPRRRCRIKSTSAFATICSFVGSSSGTAASSRSASRPSRTTATIPRRTAGGASPSSSCSRFSAATTSSPSSTGGAGARASGRSRASTTRTSRSITTSAKPGSGSSTWPPSSPSNGSARRPLSSISLTTTFSATPA